MPMPMAMEAMVAVEMSTGIPAKPITPKLIVREAVRGTMETSPSDRLRPFREIMRNMIAREVRMDQIWVFTKRSMMVRLSAASPVISARVPSGKFAEIHDRAIVCTWRDTVELPVRRKTFIRAVCLGLSIKDSISSGSPEFSYWNTSWPANTLPGTRSTAVPRSSVITSYSIHYTKLYEEKEIKGGFEVKIGGARAFCPFSQMGEKRGDQSESPVGKRLTFKILEYKQGGRSILVSNRAIVEEERAKQREAQKATLEEGMIVKGTVKSLQKFGAFVEINGLQGLLPISEIARERINEVGDVLAVGQEVEVQIIRLDWQNDRITLSLKSLLADPWESVAEKYAKGTKHEGTVSRVAAFGAFVTLESGIDGLLHVSEISGGVQHGEAKNEVKPGQKISVVIKDVDVNRITSYNVCYTKLLRGIPFGSSG